MENVPGIKSEINSNILTEFLNKLKENYDVYDEILNAANYGVPQARKRFVLHAVRKDINNELKSYGFAYSLPIATHNKAGTDGLKPWKTVREAIGDLPPIKAGELYQGNVNIHNHKCASLSETNLKRIKEIRKHGGTRTGLPDDLVLECHKKKDSNGNVTGYFFEMDKKHLSIRQSSGNNMSEEQKDAFRERAKKMREEGKLKR